MTRFFLAAAVAALGLTTVVPAEASLAKPYSMYKPKVVQYRCKPGSLGFDTFFGPYGEPMKRDRCTGVVTPNY